MRILHTSDWHLGRSLHERSLVDDQRVMLQQLLGVLRQDSHDLLIVAGDVFDRSIPSEAAVELLSGFLQQLRSSTDVPVVMIPGNHDSATRLGYGAPLFKAAGIHLRTAVNELERPVEVRASSGEEAQVWCVPFMWPGSLALTGGGARDERAGAGGERERERDVGTQAEVLDEAIARIAPHRSAGKLQIVVAHCLARGAEVAGSERPLVGQAAEIDTGVFAGFDYAALGHLHRSQQAGERVWYSGSPLKYSFSELRDHKAFLSVDLGVDRPPRVTRVPVAAPREMAVVKAGLRELLEDPVLLEQNGDRYLRVELTDAGASQTFSLLRARFPLLLDLRIVGSDVASSEPPDVLVTRRRERVDLASDLRDFLRRVHDGADPAPEVMAAFDELRRALEAGREEPS